MSKRGSGSRPKRGAGGGPRRGKGRDAAPHPARTSSTAKGGLGGDQVEGRRAVEELLVAGTRRTRELLVIARDGDPDPLAELARQLGVTVREIGRNRLDSMARTDAPQGVIARAQPLRDQILEEMLAAAGRQAFLLAADGVTDPGNLGALLRTAECAGVQGVVLPRHRAVHITPAVTKAAAGAIEHLGFSVVGGLPTGISTLRDAGVTVVGLDMDGDAGLHDLPPLDGPVAVVVGAEGQGLSRLVRQRCDVVASIPMAGAIASLNVSVAGALALYEVVRHRTH